jgi:anthranilate phosphoribosyltransferase
VVHGSGLDEIALHGETSAALLEDGRVRNITMTPSQVGLPRCDIAALRGGDPSDNARWLTELLAGGGSEAHRQAVAINAGALLWISGREPDHRAGTRAALEVLSSGAAAATLARWRQVSHGAS